MAGSGISSTEDIRVHDIEFPSAVGMGSVDEGMVGEVGDSGGDIACLARLWVWVWVGRGKEGIGMGLG